MSLTRVHNRMIEGAAVNVKDFGAVGDGVTDDTAAIQAAINYASQNGLPCVLSDTHKVSTINVPSQTTLIGSSSSATGWTTLTQISGSSDSILKSHGQSFANPNRFISIDKIKVTGDTADTTIGIDFKNVVLSTFGSLEAVEVWKGFKFEQVNDCTGEFLLSRNTIHGGEFVNGTEDNTNNIIYKYIQIETFEESGFSQIGSLATTTNTNNKIYIQRLKVESSELTASATHMIKIEVSNLCHIGIADAVMVTTQPPSGFIPVQISKGDAQTFDLLEVRDQTNFVFDTLVDIENSVGVKIPLVYYITQPVNNQLITVNNTNCSFIDIEIIRAAGNSASTFTNMRQAQSIAKANPALYDGDFKISSETENALFIERRDNSDVWQIGRIDGSGNFRMFYNGGLTSTFATNGNLIIASGDFSTGPTNGKGIICRSPDGLTLKRISIDNSGNVVAVSV